MPRLIDADKFRSFLDRQYHNCHGYSGYKKELYREALRAVKSYVHSEGQIDAVPVVRCKDCKRWERHTEVNRDYGGGRRYSSTMRYDDFCSYGERKGCDGNG